MRTSSYNIRAALPDDAVALSELAVRSKAHWGYSAEFLEACREELALDPNRISQPDYRCFVACDGDALLGYCALEYQSEDTYELDALFVEPERIGSGVGRSLMEHALNILRARKATRLVIQGDPNAHDFYLAAGARQVGSRESGSIPGRELPLYEIELGAQQSTDPS